jgi:hypothetical protein
MLAGRAHLSADDMEGRRAGSPGHRRAAEFVAENFRKAGSNPRMQPDTCSRCARVAQIVEANSSLTLETNGVAAAAELGDDAGLLLRGDIQRDVNAPLVFAGHGLVLPQYGVDDLQGLDLKGKVVVAFLAAPSSVPGSAGAHFGSPAERWKVYKAAGAVGVMFISNPHAMDLPWERAVQARLEPFMVLKGGEDMYGGIKLWAMLNPARFPLLLEGTGRNADELLALLKEGKPLPHFDLPSRIRATVDAQVTEVTSENVVGVLPGSDPKLRDEYVVLTAHLDHLGVREHGRGRPDLQRCDGQCVGHLRAHAGGARSPGKASASKHRVRGRHGRGARAPGFASLCGRCARARASGSSRTSTPTCSCPSTR